MTSRERVLTAINHQDPDRIPLDMGSTQVTGISKKAHENLRQWLDLPKKETAICDKIQQLAIPDQDVMDALGIDIKGLWPVMNHTDFIDSDDGEYLSHKDEWQFEYRFHKKDGLWYDLVRHPMADVQLSQNVIQDFVWPKGNETRRIAGLRTQAEMYQQEGYAVMLKGVCAGLFEMVIRLRGMQNAMMGLMMDPDNTKRLLEHILQFKIDYWNMALDELGDWVDIVAEGDDFGTQASQLISYQTYQEMIQPFQKQLIETMKSKAPHAKVFFHSCGNVRPFLPDFIEMGIDILNPVHITAEGMDPFQLKKDFGRDVVFWGGGIDTQGVLPVGTPEQVQDDVKRNIEALAPGGGFVFNTVHNIQADVPPENIMAMIEALHEAGVY